MSTEVSHSVAAAADALDLAVERAQIRRPAVANRLLTPREVAALFSVSPKTVSRWANVGKLRAIRTLGGHHRFDASEVYRMLEEAGAEPDRGWWATETPAGARR
jgi:excisionase family DNA binding protein